MNNLVHFRLEGGFTRVVVVVRFLHADTLSETTTYVYGLVQTEKKIKNTHCSVTRLGEIPPTWADFSTLGRVKFLVGRWGGLLHKMRK